MNPLVIIYSLDVIPNPYYLFIEDIKCFVFLSSTVEISVNESCLKIIFFLHNKETHTGLEPDIFIFEWTFPLRIEYL